MQSDPMRAAIRSFRNADTELRRAIGSDDAERQFKAGTRYAIAKIKLFQFAKGKRNAA